MDCILLRHGIAVEREEWEGADADRPLIERGAKRVAQVAAGLKRLGIEPTHLFSSPLVRAVETVRLLQAALHVEAPVNTLEALSPDAAPEGLLTILLGLPPEAVVLCVGHEPHLGLVASVMLAGKPSTSFPFKKAGACLIELAVPVKPGRGTLRWWMGPAQLRALGKKTAKLEI